MDNVDEGLLFEGMLPVSFLVVDSIPDDTQLALINEKNESFLKSSLISPEPVDIDEHDEIGLELRRQDLKISMLLDMVAELLIQKNRLPPAIMLKLTAKGLECESRTGESKTGDKVEVALYITPFTPIALKLYGEVLVSNKESGTVISFVGVNQTLRGWLEKFIFRYHRRTIAQRLAPK